MGTVLHSHAFTAIKTDTCIKLLGVQAEELTLGCACLGRHSRGSAVPVPVKRDTRNSHCILMIIFLCFVLLPNLLYHKIQESSHRDCIADSIFIHVSAVLPLLMRIGSV